MKRTLLSSLLALTTTAATALTLPVPDRPGDSLIGSPPHEVKYVAAKYEDTLIDIAVEHRLGQDEIVLANPHVDRWLPGEGTPVRIPTSFILPNAPRQGIVVNLPEMRVYYYPNAHQVVTYAIGIGRENNWRTPLGRTHIAAKMENPSWTPPPSIIAEHLADGDVLDPYYPPGPNNPLGLFAMRLGISGYLMHSTQKTNGIGMRVSHGCIRMYPSDIEQFFPMVKVGTSVNIVNQSIKVGWYHDTLYMEVYPEMEEWPASYEQRLHTALNLIEQANGGQIPVVKGSILKMALEKPTGIPVAVYERPSQASTQTTVQN
ncbi:L,D-transpeptidase family protein [Methylomonas sp. SURF-2]|uniref:L,D-transpeptidase family protein n=1 Tax=Methylomonas subterranea TaxID=2952225 RepID=A0ABT1TFN4_9GAMM|nr:L,D-transpeptidase family protein [Methylomonas sp. SURF-2]MCQ8104287.1 L,D-transpeptidase family protein [Methylomonas sp. SURF-2]